MWVRLYRQLKDEEGASMVEYALLLALIFAVCLGAVTALGTRTESTFRTAADLMP